jgi:hypothetical protein
VIAEHARRFVPAASAAAAGASRRLADGARARAGAWWEAREVHHRLYVGGRGVLDAVAPDWTEHAPDAFAVGAGALTEVTRTLVLDWPEEVPPDGGWLTPLRAQGDVTVSLHVAPIPPGRATGKLKGQRLWQTSAAQARAAAERLADPDTEQAITDADSLLRAVRRRQVRLFSCTLGVVLRAPTIEALEELERGVRAHCDTVGAPLRRATWAHATGFRSHGVPYGRDTLAGQMGGPRTIDSRVLAATFPYQGEKVSMGRGVWYGRSVVGWYPVLLDVWDDRPADRGGGGFAAPHMCVVGPTGWGKTTALSVAMRKYPLVAVSGSPRVATRKSPPSP